MSDAAPYGQDLGRTEMIALPSGLRLLIVEDETLVAMAIESLLTDLGCLVVGSAASVSGGLAIADDDAVQLDAAVLDVNLDGEKVYPLAQRLTALGIPFIFSTAYAASSIDPEFSDVPLLAKPYESPMLAATLQTALAARGGSSQQRH